MTTAEHYRAKAEELEKEARGCRDYDHAVWCRREARDFREYANKHEAYYGYGR